MKRSFDRLARAYHTLERMFFGGLLQRTRTAHLAHLHAARRVLLLGEGDGRFLERLLLSNPTCEVFVVDQSSQMLERARCRIGSVERVTFCCGDAVRQVFPPDVRYDAIVTPFFLDCFEGDELTRLLGQLTRQAEPNACWVVADFSLGEGRCRQCWQRLGLWLLYRAFGALTDIRARRWCDPLPSLVALGWQLRAERRFAAGWLRSCVLVRPPERTDQSALLATSHA